MKAKEIFDVISSTVFIWRDYKSYHYDNNANDADDAELESYEEDTAAANHHNNMRLLHDWMSTFHFIAMDFKMAEKDATLRIISSCTPDKFFNKTQEINHLEKLLSIFFTMTFSVIFFA